jgi:hypothetical protein
MPLERQGGKGLRSMTGACSVVEFYTITRFKLAAASEGSLSTNNIAGAIMVEPGHRNADPTLHC